MKTQKETEKGRQKKDGSFVLGKLLTVHLRQRDLFEKCSRMNEPNSKMKSKMKMSNFHNIKTMSLMYRGQHFLKNINPNETEGDCSFPTASTYTLLVIIFAYSLIFLKFSLYIMLYCSFSREPARKRIL